MIATDMTSSCGTSDEKLRWAFKMYDEDGSGKFPIYPLSVTSKTRLAVNLLNPYFKQNTIVPCQVLPFYK